MNRIQITNIIISRFGYTYNEANQLVSYAHFMGSADLRNGAIVTYDYVAHTYSLGDES